jgi:hypothetical protein
MEQCHCRHSSAPPLLPAPHPRYFQGQGTMLLTHHIGISRDAPELPYLYVDGTVASQVTSNANPYGHWLYNQEGYYFLKPENDCAAAFGELRVVEGLVWCTRCVCICEAGACCSNWGAPADTKLVWSSVWCGGGGRVRWGACVGGAVMMIVVRAVQAG